jgi:hypothetical protein
MSPPPSSLWVAAHGYFSSPLAPLALTPCGLVYSTVCRAKGLRSQIGHPSFPTPLSLPPSPPFLASMCLLPLSVTPFVITSGHDSPIYLLIMRVLAFKLFKFPNLLLSHSSNSFRDLSVLSCPCFFHFILY